MEPTKEIQSQFAALHVVLISIAWFTFPLTLFQATQARYNHRGETS